MISTNHSQLPAMTGVPRVGRRNIARWILGAISAVLIAFLANAFIHGQIEWQFVARFMTAQAIWHGLLNTSLLTVMTMGLAVVLGIIAALMKISSNPVAIQVAMKRILGIIPVGYRAPWGDTCTEQLELLKNRGILYSSSFRDDTRPYRHVLPSGKGPIEILVNYSFDDWSYGITHRTSPRAMFGRQEVLSIWRDEFDQTREWGGVTTMVMDPQVTGRPMRIGILDRFLTHVRQFDDVWIATGAEIAKHYVMKECAK